MGGNTPRSKSQNRKNAPEPRAGNSERSASSRGKKRGPGRPFATGVSGNPAGRPPSSAVVHAFMETMVKGTRRGRGGDPRRTQVLEAMFKLATTPNRDQVKSAELLLAYDFGRPRERVEMSGPRGGPIETADTTRPRRMTTGEMRKELEAIEARRKARMSRSGTSPTPDVPAAGGDGGVEPAATPEGPIPDEPPAEDDAGGPPSDEDPA